MVKHYFVVAQGGGLQFLSDAFGYLLELFRRELQVWCIEAHVGLALHGDEVDVGMGNFEPQHALSYFDAGDGTLDGVGYLLRRGLCGDRGGAVGGVPLAVQDRGIGAAAGGADHFGVGGADAFAGL